MKIDCKNKKHFYIKKYIYATIFKKTQKPVPAAEAARRFRPFRRTEKGLKPKKKVSACKIGPVVLLLKPNKRRKTRNIMNRRYFIGTAALLAVIAVVALAWGARGLVPLLKAVTVLSIFGLLIQGSSDKNKEQAAAETREAAPKTSLVPYLTALVFIVGSIWGICKLEPVQKQQKAGRQEKKEAEEDYLRLIAAPTPLDCSSFLSGHPQSPHIDEVRERYYALAQNDPNQLYALAVHPNGGPQGEKARQKLEACRYRFHPLAYATPETSSLTVENNSDYRLTIQYQGPEEQKVMLMPHETKTFALPNGEYLANASIADSGSNDPITLKSNHYTCTYRAPVERRLHTFMGRRGRTRTVVKDLPTLYMEMQLPPDNPFLTHKEED